ncbi:MAG: hypothetical protein Q8L66_14685 [Caulobacter sp.]|nr:hypothetical protein [Caulobacter sp.]MDP1963923.1 hypothetical protein [Reyranella sp.]
MSVTRTNSFRRQNDHFEPEDQSDPQAQRRIRGLLEQIDYTAFAANKSVISQALGAGDPRKFQRLAVAAAAARATWVAQALAVSAGGGQMTPQDLSQLTHLRATFEELAEAYEAMRRMVERGYVSYAPPTETAGV